MDGRVGDVEKEAPVEKDHQQGGYEASEIENRKTYRTRCRDGVGRDNRVGASH
jgi:hypothetical protein